jgi:hypothetical protein
VTEEDRVILQSWARLISRVAANGPQRCHGGGPPDRKDDTEDANMDMEPLGTQATGQPISCSSRFHSLDATIRTDTTRDDGFMLLEREFGRGESKVVMAVPSKR